jgi:hypothetical protein
MESNQIKSGIGGWLSLFCFGLVVFVPLLTLGSLAELEKYRGFYSKFPSVANFVRFDQVVRVIISILGIFVGLNLYKIKYNSLKMAKSFLLVIVIYGCIYGVSPILFTRLPKEIENSLWDLSLVTGLKIIGTAGIWSLYLKNSSRVKNTYLS